MSPEFVQLYHDLNANELRIRRPSRFIFFCGGSTAAPGSVRHYLLNDRSIQPRLRADVILAERANQLYRDSDYSDLITFEEDIAQISALVLLIAESAGSFAELGAFASTEAIRSRLAVMVQTQYEDAESFVRFGPVERIKKHDDRRIGAFPWRLNKKHSLVKSSIRSHVKEITRFINEMIAKTPIEELFRNNHRLQPFVIILWILHMSAAISITDLAEYAKVIFRIDQSDLRNKLYCMKFCGWVAKYRYSGRDYWYATHAQDPITKYRFLPGVQNDILRRKAEATRALANDLKIPRHVREYVAGEKGSRV